VHLLPCNSPEQAARFHIFGIEPEDFNSNRHQVGVFGIQAEDFISNRHLVDHKVRDLFLNVSQHESTNMTSEDSRWVVEIQDLLFWDMKKCSLVDCYSPLRES
jgi:hypothetical protein